MLAAHICRELHFGVVSSRMQSRVPRCLFGPPNPRDTMELLQEALETERSRFAKRWGVDPLAEDEDKENNAGRHGLVHRHSRQQSCSPSKRRTSPYAKQTSIHDYWRTRKTSESGKKSGATGGVLGDASTRQQQQRATSQSPTEPPAANEPSEAQLSPQPSDKPASSSPSQ